MNVYEKINEVNVGLALEVFIGPAAGRFKLFDKTYVYESFINGVRHVEGRGGSNYMGEDVELSELVALTADVLLSEAKKRDAEALVFRAKCLGDKLCKMDSYIDDSHMYHPPGVQLWVRVAFICRLDDK